MGIRRTRERVGFLLLGAVAVVALVLGVGVARLTGARVSHSLSPDVRLRGWIIEGLLLLSGIVWAVRILVRGKPETGSYWRVAASARTSYMMALVLVMLAVLVGGLIGPAQR